MNKKKIIEPNNYNITDKNLPIYFHYCKVVNKKDELHLPGIKYISLYKNISRCLHQSHLLNELYKEERNKNEL